MISIEGYKVTNKLSSGPFGEICEIIDIETQQAYAMKALLKSYLAKTQTMKQARLEGSFLEMLDHPGIIKLHETLEDENYLYFVMQLGGRGDLKGLLSNAESIDKWKPETKVTLAQILDTIGYLHSFGIVHCDVKPENIVIMAKGGPKLVDFGSGKIFDKELLTEEMSQRCDSYMFQEKPVLSPQFTSPETIKGKTGPARDVWAFGVMAYWIFHNKLPFVGSSQLEIYEKIQNSEPQLQQTLSEPAKALIRDCLTKDPESRPTVSELKFYDYFHEIDFKQIFHEKEKQNVKQKVLDSWTVQKKMFFGNYKARILKLTVQNNQVYLAYCYPQSGTVKNKLKLSPSDFAEQSQENAHEFFVRTKEQKLHFKSPNKVTTSNCVRGINEAIKKYYQL